MELDVREAVAEALGVKPGDTVYLGGRALTLIATFDARRFRALTSLDGQPLTPFDYFALPDLERQKAQQRGTDIQMLASEMASGQALAVDKGIPRLDGTRLIVVHASVFRKIGPGELRGIALPAVSHEDARRIAFDLSHRLELPVYYSSAQGTRVVFPAPGSAWSSRGPSQT